ncbi:dUTP diphosphatase [Candidatus Nomurabacteria bacterium]|nr:dUTP diphosphatase [Candidatus Nomurabacteria bacterium]
MQLKVKKLYQDAKLPSYAHSGDVGMDVYSLENKTLAPMEHYIFFLGFAMEFPTGYAAIVKDKSSISKAGLHTMGGVYDAGYRGEYNVHIVNLSNNEYKIEKGDKIAQIILYPIAIAKIKEVNNLSESTRGSGGFGSTGKK